MARGGQPVVGSPVRREGKAMDRTLVAGIFARREQAREGIDRLLAVGVRPDQISILTTDPREAGHYAEEVGTRVIRGGLAGTAIGSIAGGLLGWAAAGLVVPGIGLVIAVGPLGAALLAAAAAGSVGGFIGVLLGLGLPHSAAQEFERELGAGRTVVLVQPDVEPVPAETARIEAALYGAGAVGVRRVVRSEPVAEQREPAAPESRPPEVDGIGVPFAQPEASGPGHSRGTGRRPRSAD
ncbi:MAG: hypothetical protein HY320_01210 [Armatimonadetes bacterium]|nr:hypothetical protein [Armatimonadota bacterium]